MVFGVIPRLDPTSIRRIAVRPPLVLETWLIFEVNLFIFAFEKLITSLLNFTTRRQHTIVRLDLCKYPQRNKRTHLACREFQSADVQCRWRPSEPASASRRRSVHSRAGSREGSRSRGSPLPAASESMIQFPWCLPRWNLTQQQLYINCAKDLCSAA